MFTRIFTRQTGITSFYCNRKLNDSFREKIDSAPLILVCSKYLQMLPWEYLIGLEVILCLYMNKYFVDNTFEILSLTYNVFF